MTQATLAKYWCVEEALRDLERDGRASIADICSGKKRVSDDIMDGIEAMLAQKEQLLLQLMAEEDAEKGPNIVSLANWKAARGK